MTETVAKFKNYFMPTKPKNILDIFNTKKYDVFISKDRQFIEIKSKLGQKQQYDIYFIQEWR